MIENGKTVSTNPEHFNTLKSLIVIAHHKDYSVVKAFDDELELITALLPNLDLDKLKTLLLEVLPAVTIEKTKNL